MSLLTTFRRAQGYPASAFAPLYELQREFNRLVDPEADEAQAVYSPALDVQENEQSVVATLEVPGFNKEDVQVSFHDNVLTISGERKVEKDAKDKGYHIRERAYGRFLRKVYVPIPVDTNAIKAVSKDGVLTVTLPKTAEAKPRQIDINTN